MRYEELLVRVQKDYPRLNFRAGKRFCWRAPRTVVYEQFFESGNCGLKKAANVEQKSGSSLPPDEKNVNSLPKIAQKTGEVPSSEPRNEQNFYSLQLLHELGHALLGHRDFRTDPERIKMECAAWEKARELAQIYHIYYDEDFVEDELDTYRDWLYRRSKCPECGVARYQDRSGKYHCPMCESF